MCINQAIKFYCNTLPPKNNLLNLLQIGWDKCAPGDTFSQYRDMYIIHYIKSGTGTIEVNNNKYTLSQNDAYIVRPNILTVQTADTDDPWELYFFSFNGSLANDIIEKTVFNNGAVSVAIKNSNLCEAITESAFELNDSSQNELVNYAHLFKLLAYFDYSNNISISQNKNDGFYQKATSKVQQYIQLNYSKKIKISELADSLNISRAHLYKIFKNDTGTSIENYLVTVRMNEARRLLEDTDLSIAEISSLGGYTQYYNTFSKMFKRYTGLTPSQYRIKKVRDLEKADDEE